MRTVNFRDDVLFALAYRMGLDPRQNLLSEQANAFTTFINSWVRRLYERFDWPEWTVIEQRTPDSNHFVPFDQANQTEIAKVYKVYIRNPFTTPGPIDTPFKLNENGVHCGFEHGTNVWIKFGRPAPRFTATPHDLTKTYAIGDTVYDPTTGNCYSSKTAANINHAVSAITYWELIPFPAALADAVVRGAYSDALRDEGKVEAGASEEQNANAQMVEKAAAQIVNDYDALTDQAGAGGSRYQRGAAMPAGGAPRGQ